MDAPNDNDAYTAALVQMGIEPTPALCEQLQVFVTALKICDQRTDAYGELWRQYGARSNLLSVARKTDRLMASGWFNTDKNPLTHKDALDDAYDLLNYTAFFIRNALEGNLDGAPPERLEKRDGPLPGHGADGYDRP